MMNERIFVCSIVSLLGVLGVQITDLRVPPAVRNGSGSAALLDCEYTLRPEELSEESGLVVKWFFNNGPEPVYQWIPGQKPQELGILRGKLKLGHKASDNVATMHRALYILNPTTELSGEYKCSVSTFKDEDFMIKKMVVFSPEKTMDLRHSKPGEDSVNITCRAQGVYPEPKIALFKDPGRKSSGGLEGVRVLTTPREGMYDIAITKLLEDSELENPTTFDCELQIPEANYAVRKSILYYPGLLNSPTDSSCCTIYGTPISPLFLFTWLLTKLCFC